MFRLVVLESEGANKMTFQPDQDKKVTDFSLFPYWVVAVQFDNQEMPDWSAESINFNLFIEAHQLKIRFFLS